VGSISDGVIGIFHLLNFSACTVALGLTAANRNEYQEYFMADKGGQCLGLKTLPHYVPIIYKYWGPQHRAILTAFPGFYRDCFT
jgi:hypothetical protein